MRPNWTALTVALLVASGVLFVSHSAAQQEPQESKRKVVTRVVPAYPELARKMQIEGTVRLVATVAPNGVVKSTLVLGGSPVLAQAAQAAVSKWKWAPAPQESQELVEFRFHPQ